jgi:hypothetical protein
MSKGGTKGEPSMDQDNRSIAQVKEVGCWQEEK